MARERPIAHLTAAAMCLLLLFSLTGTGAATDDLATGERIMVNNVWIDVPLTQVFRDISIETGVVIAVGPQVPDIVVSLDAGLGKPLRECLRELIAGQGLYIHKENDRFYLVSSGNPSSPGFGEIAKSKRMYLKYITAKHLRSSLPPSIQQYVSSGERPNEVLVYTVPDIMDRIMEIVRKLDNTFSMEAGLGAFTGLAQYTSVPKSQLTGLLATLRALVGKQKANIRSRPRVATLNGEEAIIDISLDEYFTVVTDIYTAGTLRTELQVITSGVLLKITPHIGDDSDITVDVLTEVSDVASRQNQLAGNESGDLPIIRRRKAETTVRVKEGDAIVIGGLIETQQRSEDKRVPFLSSIPLVGGIFTTKDDSTLKKEVIIFITPRLIEEGQMPGSRGHDLLSPEKELQSLRKPPPSPEAQLLNRQNAFTIAQELNSLQDVVSLIGGRHENRLPGAFAPDKDDQAGIALSHREDLPSLAEEIEALQEIVALLDVRPQPRRNSLDINNEP
jgi:type II secretory pathway component GspD/PulD (secretin)